eukprot:8681398-Alexandrium_andersonii.AAC.1
MVRKSISLPGALSRAGFLAVAGSRVKCDGNVFFCAGSDAVRAERAGKAAKLGLPAKLNGRH